MHVIVVGGGIGGLTTALSLHAAGISVEVHEQVAELKPLGVGINLLPHAVRELTELGLQDRLAAIAIPTRELIYANRHGQEIWREARGREAGYGWPQFSIHRGWLQMLLLDVAKERIGADRIFTDHAVSGFEDDGRRVVARFVGNDGSDRGTATGDVLIACDGIHSAVRKTFYPDEGPPKWNGCVLWRGTTEGPPYLSGRSMVMAGHQDQKFVCYPISAEHAGRGRSLINWIAEIRFRDRDLWRRESWNRQGDLAEFLPAFEGWAFDWLDVPGVIRGGGIVYEYPMVDRDPLERWTFGRVTLLGDAAHPMYPIGSNGASQAILDARTIAWHLATAPDVETGLARYEEDRRPATSRIVLANRGNGPEQVMQLAEERASGGFTNVEDVIPRAELERIAADYKRTAGFEVERLNTRPSLTPPVRVGG
jgi:2-polyprenyl-6-methoxyphenol hydroxylase-like FAD-dependent oxidoreductase